MADVLGRILDNAGMVYNVHNTDFAGGAPTNGTSDAAPAIQAAIDAAAAAGGGTVVLGPHTYVVATTLALKSNVRLRGWGRAATLVRDHGSLGAHRIMEAIGASNARLTNVAVEGLTVTNGTSSTSTYTVGREGMRTEYVDGVCVEDCGFDGIAGPAALSVKRSTEVQVSRCHFLSYTYAGLQIMIECEDVRVTDNVFDGPLSESYGSVYTIAMGGENTNEGVFFSRNVWIERNHVRSNPRWEGIDCHGCENLWIRDNVVENCLHGIAVQVVGGFVSEPVLRNVRIEGNTVVQGGGGDGGYGVVVSSTVVATPAENVTIRNNLVTGFGGTTSSNGGAITAYSTRNAFIEENVMTGWRMFGVCLYHNVQGGTVVNNVFNDMGSGSFDDTFTAAVGLRAHGSYNIRIDGNDLRPFTPGGIPRFGIWAPSTGFVHADVGEHNTWRAVVTGLYSNATIIGLEYASIPTTNRLFLRYGQAIYSNAGKLAWRCTATGSGGTKVGFGCLDTTVVPVTVTISLGTPTVAAMTASASDYRGVPQGANVSIAGAGAAGAALLARVIANDGTNLLLDTAASTAVTGANLTFQAPTVAAA